MSFWTNKPLSPKYIGAQNLIVKYLARVIVEFTNLAGTKGALFHIRMHRVRVDSFLFERDDRVESSFATSLVVQCFLYISTIIRGKLYSTFETILTTSPTYDSRFSSTLPQPIN